MDQIELKRRRTPRAVIFDLNGVLLIGPKLSARFARDFQVPEDEFMATMSDIKKQIR